MRRPSPLPSPVAVGTLLTIGAALLLCRLVPIGPDLLGGLGALVVTTTYTWVLAARTGGRPVLFAALVAAMGVVVLVTDITRLRTGAAVLTCSEAAVLGVMTTVPAQRFAHAVRECSLAVVTAGLGALATVAWEPAVSLVRFEYTTLVLALIGAFVLVYRLGAGLHGLGRRGLLAVLVGGVVLVVTLAYAELLRRYGPGGFVDDLLSGVHWSRDHLGAFPRPIETVLGVPALAWGCHMRARRRQGWWVCAFGVAATTPVANALMNPEIGLLEVVLSVVYGLVIGLAIGYALIRADLALTGPRGRRARRAEEERALRPEPARTRPLF